MTVDVKIKKPSEITEKSKKDAVLIYGVTEDKSLSGISDKNHASLIKAQFKKSPNFKGKASQYITVCLGDDDAYSSLLVLGLGKETDCIRHYEDIGAKLYLILNKMGASKAVFHHDDNMQATHIAAGVKLRSYDFDKYKSEKKNKGDIKLGTFIVAGDDVKSLKSLWDDLDAGCEGTFIARDLLNEPPNVLYPESFADIVKSDLKPLGVQITILDHKRLEKLGFGAHIAVGKGSERKPCSVIMQWNGGKKSDKPVALVGKGVTFDTGGISLKPGNGMELMKMDMGGAAAVVGAMKTLALRKAKKNVVAIIGLAENMPSSNAYRPSDIITSLAGKTIEVINTDAEGRLVLADNLTYVQREFDPSHVIDLATLTGAIMVALGTEYAGAFVNDDDLWDGLKEGSVAAGEKLWRMPLDENYRKDMKSSVADLNNLGAVSRYGGACTAAAFLEHFIDEGRPWAHMDIAGTAWNSRGKPLAAKNFALGQWARTLDRFVENV